MGCSWCLLAMLLTLVGREDVEASALRKDVVMTSLSGSCAEAGLCCQGKNNTCRVRHHRGAITDDDDDDNSVFVVARRKTCFCDAACLDLDDCCHDYKQACTRKKAHFVIIIIRTLLLLLVLFLYTLGSIDPEG